MNLHSKSINDIQVNNEEIKKDEQRKKTFNGLCASEWAQMSRSVWNDVSSARKKAHINHGATYPEKLCSRLIKMYSAKGDTVLDPFLGTGTTVAAAVKLNRNAVGIELTEHFFETASEQIANELNTSQLNLFFGAGSYDLFNGDSEQILKTIPDSKFQLTVTSPPYADLIHKVVEDRTLRHKKSAFVTENNAATKIYSDDKRDLGNMPLDIYTEKAEKIMREIYRTTKPGGYNVWIVKDFRDTKNGVPYVDFHSKIAAIGEAAGFKYHDLIIWDQNEHRRLVLLGYPSVFYVNQNHSYIIVMRKPK